MAAVLAATGAFLYFRLESELDRTLDDGLRIRVAEVAARVAVGSQSAARVRLVEDQDAFTEVVDGRGRVLEQTSSNHPQPVLGAAELARVEASPPSFFVRRAPGDDDRWRVVAARVTRSAMFESPPLFVVVGTSLEQRDDALDSLLAQLLIGFPLALVVASLAGYGVAAAALRPVESMRRRAAAISGERAGERLPVPPADDEIGRLGETLNAMLARLESALARERTFVADASHELRTPLALLKTELELALRRPRPPEELERALRSAADETDRLAQLAEDLLVLARSDRGELPLRRERVVVRSLLERVAERFSRRAAEAGRTLAVDAPAGLAVDADALRLEQALGNLVDNALRHGGGAIVLAAGDEGAVVTLHVADEGAGFPHELLPRAFERFARGDEARSGGGTGLGLAIVDVIARAHGGSAHAGNRAPGGADVWLELPGRG
jgi:heavy metal sensor kinase